MQSDEARYPNRRIRLIASATPGRGFLMATSGKGLPTLDKFLLISLGAIAGANARYWITVWSTQKFGTGFPVGTLIVNLTGSLLIGLVISLAGERILSDPRLRLMLTAGFLGAYTTFSAYTLEGFYLISAGFWLQGLAYLTGSMLLGVLAVGGGVLLARLF